MKARQPSLAVIDAKRIPRPPIGRWQLGRGDDLPEDLNQLGDDQGELEEPYRSVVCR